MTKHAKRYLHFVSIALIVFLTFGAGLNLARAADFIIAVDDYSRLYYAESNGDGTFSNYGFLDYLGGYNSRGVTINDFNNDGHMDFIAGRGISSTAYYYLFLNDGSNNFTKSGIVGTLSNASSWAMDMASGDFNNDGNMDFIANGNQSTTGLYLGDGMGNFTKTEMNLGSYGRGMDTGDFDHDGHLDFVRARYSSGYINVYWGDGTGAFPSNLQVGDSGTDPYGVVAADFTNDGNMDIIANYGSNGDPKLWTGNGDRTFTYVGYVGSLDFNNHGCYDGFDFDGDGNIDVVAANYTGKRVYYYPGNGDGTFGSAVEIGTTSYNCMGLSAPPLGPPDGVPTAVISPATQTIAEGGTADFDGSGSFDWDGVLASWVWNFGDGTSTESGTGTDVGTTDHDYADEGTYLPNLKVTDDDNKNDYEAAVVIVEGDTPAVDTTPVTFGELLADDGFWNLLLDGVNYASDTEGIVSYQWDLDDGCTDNFEDADTVGWDGFAGTWGIESAAPITGLHSYRQTDAGPDRTWTLVNKVFDTDVTIEADVYMVSGSGEEVQIIFRAKNHYNNYEYILRGRGNNDVLLYRRVNEGATNVFEYDLPSDFPSYPIDTGNTYRIKIVCIGSQIEFYLDGILLFTHSDSTFSSGKVGFSTYRTDALFDNLTVTATATGQTVQHAFEGGTFNVDLTVADAAEQADTGIIPMTMQAGGPPTADADGPYSADESAASEGGWTFSLDGSGSSDDVEIRKYVWDFGQDTFDGTSFQSEKWHTNGGITQSDAVSLTGANTWNTRYMVSKATFPKVKGQVFQAKIMTTGSGQSMFGFKNENTTNFHYNQFPYEFYLANGNIYIYENSSYRGDTRYNYSYNTWYDFKIELKETGAVYSYRLSGTSDWHEVYNSGYTTGDTNLRKGMVVHSGTWSMDDFLETTAGQSPDFTLYKGTGTFGLDLTVYDRAGQSDTDSTTVVITDGDPPVADAGPDQTKNETDAADGSWTVNFDASGSTDDYGIYTYEWDFDDDGVFDDTGSTVAYTWTAPGIYTVATRVTDHALQSHIDTMTVTITQGDPPTADADGPYTVDENTGNAFEGGWTVALDGSGSSDNESSISKYVWDLGTDEFNGTVINNVKWVYNSNVTQNDEISIVGNNSWGQRYLFSKDTYTRANGMAFEAKVKHSSHYAMVGFKNTNTNYSYTQMPYAIYFNHGNIYIYENGANRGDTGYNYSFNTWYEVLIELKETQGARYYYRTLGSPDWIFLYDSSYSSETAFLRGTTIRYGTFTIDDYREFAAGPTPSYRFYCLGSHTISLTVYDQVAQADTDFSSVTTQANDPPVADAGPDKSGDESDAFENTWIIDFDGTGSTDDYGIYTYEWDFDYDGTFDPSGDTADTATHIYTGAGIYTVALRVTDHALQSTIDTATVTLTNGDPPVAEAGPDQITEGYWPVVFNGGNSTDDVGVYKYEWDFGDGTTDTGKTPTHIYWNTGDYTVTLTVYDQTLQSDSDTMVVHVIAAGDPPVADAGGPYNAGAGGPPAYLNGSSSTDDYGIVKYLWDVDNSVDSDGDGDFTNDMDVVGRKPFYTYPTAGTYTVTLTVEDGAGQTAVATSTVNVATNLAPDVICVPWRSGDPTIPHETYNGRSIRLKAIVRDAGTLTYQWNFGDGSAVSPATPATVSNKYAIEAGHTYPDSTDGTPYTATLTVWDSSGLVGTDNYYVIVRPNNLDTRTNIAIDEGLWYQHKNQDRSGSDYGKWSSYSSYYASPTASAIQSFEINGHLQDGDNQENPYVETVNRGFEYLFKCLQSYNISAQTYGNPDSNGNGIGIETNGSREIYEGGMVMDAIASSNMPLAFATTGGTNINGRFYYHILTDMVDMYAWGQDDLGSDRGGWRYNWNSDADNSACQWAAIGMLAAEDNFGINVPDFVKEQNDYWLNYSYNGTGFGYTGPGNGVATTPSGMVQLAFCDKYTSDPRWITAEDYNANYWQTNGHSWQYNNFYGLYAWVKAMRLARPTPVVILQATGLDWYSDPITGINKRILDLQTTSGGYWGSWLSGGYGGRGLNTSWAIIMLTPSLFVQPPVADAGDDIIWAYDLELRFDASGSFHMDPSRSLVRYEWDFNGDGIWDFTTSDPSDSNAKYTYPDPQPLVAGDPPQIYTVRLRVTDDNEPPQTDIDTREVTVTEPPHAPFAMHGGAYTATVGIPFTLDASGSYDVDLGDSVSLYQWDLDNDGVWFDDVDLETTNTTATWIFTAPGVYNIGLKVWDNGAFNPLGCTLGVDCISMNSTPVYTTVTVNINLPPVADAGGPYVVNEGTLLILDGSGSSDANGDTLYFFWDLDDDGDYDDSTAEMPTWTWLDDGVYTVGLRVSDSLLDDTDTAAVTVNDLAPTASFTWHPEPQDECSAVNFTDTSASSPDIIAGWSWDFGGLGTSSDQNPGFTFNDNGIYTVTLLVTDDDGSTDTISHDVTITDKGPTADLTGDTTIDECSFGNYDADGSTSPCDAIVLYEWDWDYDGSAFNASGDTGAIQSHRWMDDGVYTVAVRVTDDDGSTDMATLVVTVNDLGPAANLNGDMAIDECSAGNYDASGSSRACDCIVSFEWDWEYDGTTFNASDTGVTASHTWMDDGVYTVAVRVTDDDGSTDIATLTVTVNDLSLTASLTGDTLIDEGASGNYNAAGSISPCDAIVLYEWDWDYNGSTFNASGDTGATQNHTWNDDGSYTVAVQVTDDDGSTDMATLVVTVHDHAGPTAVLTGDTPLNEGDTGSYDASGSFVAPPDSIVSYEWDWNYDGTFDASGDTGANQTHAWGTAGTYTVAVQVTDNDGASDIATLVVTVNSSGPAVDIWLQEQQTCFRVPLSRTLYRMGLKVLFKNLGAGTAENVRITLMETPTNLQISKGVSDLGDIGPGGEKWTACDSGAMDADIEVLLNRLIRPTGSWRWSVDYDYNGTHYTVDNIPGP